VGVSADDHIVVAQFLSILERLGVSARAEAVPTPVPMQYDSGATCSLILGR
jgi:hypothetical protein